MRNLEESRLLRLLAELRNKIYKHVFGGMKFCKSAFDEIKALEFLSNCDQTIVKVDPFWRLQQVCRTIYAEAALIPFTGNAFCYHFNHLLRLQWFTLPVQLNLIRTVFCRIDLDNPLSPPKPFPRPVPFKGLEKKNRPPVNPYICVQEQ